MERQKRVKIKSKFPRGDYLEALILSDRHQQREVEVEVDKLPSWKGGVRVSDKVIRRRGGDLR